MPGALDGEAGRETEENVVRGKRWSGARKAQDELMVGGGTG